MSSNLSLDFAVVFCFALFSHKHRGMFEIFSPPQVGSTKMLAKLSSSKYALAILVFGTNQGTFALGLTTDRSSSLIQSLNSTKNIF